MHTHYWTGVPQGLTTQSPHILQEEKDSTQLPRRYRYWVRGQAPLESTVASPAVYRLIHAQRQIGWTRFLRGFLSKQWQDYLEYELNYNDDAPATARFEYYLNFSGLIKIMWEHQSKFWMEFKQQLRQTQGTTQIRAGNEEYKLEVRHLYSLRGQVLSQHRDD